MRLAPEPTEFLPGTPEKIDVMMQRMEDGYCIFHPLDASAGSEDYTDRQQGDNFTDVRYWSYIRAHTRRRRHCNL